jgi:hypothetical protein
MEASCISIYQIIKVSDEDLSASLIGHPLFCFMNYTDDIFYSPLLFSYN